MKFIVTGFLLFLFFLIISPFQQQDKITIEKGPFEPKGESLMNYECPEWFRDAKFGIWAHYGVQCAPEDGDWYARKMYEQYDRNLKPGKTYQYHLEHYGHPSEFGFKDIIPTWKAEKLDADKLLELYKKAGAKYFVAMANHHDNFDNYNSTHQEWNSVNMGPKRDLIAEWAEAAKKHGLRFGVSNHSSHAWHWYQKAYAYDVEGPYKGIRYDGWATKEQGKGKWWEGYDPQELYGGNHYAPPDGFETKEEMHEWFSKYDKWYKTIPEKDNGYSLKWFLRCKELIDNYDPDLLYFDDHGLPLEEYGLNIAAHFYNTSIKRNKGNLEAVINAKHMDSIERKMVVLDIERGKQEQLDPLPWQTDDCIGVWHYRRGQKYKTVGFVVKYLIDIVSKNGNLLLSIPIRSDGTLDEEGIDFLEGMGRFMTIYGEGIYGTRPWEIFGEGPLSESSAVSEGHGEVTQKSTRPLDANDIRFTTKDGDLYLFVLGNPENDIQVRSLGRKSRLYKEIKSIEMLGNENKISWKQNEEALIIEKPEIIPNDYAIAFKVKF